MSDKKKSGDPLRISAQWFNDTTDAKDDYIRRRAISVTKETRHYPISTDKIRFQNDTGAARRLGEVVSIDNVILIDIVDPEHLWQSGVTTNTALPFGILRHPTPSSVIDELQVSGVCKALVNIGDTSHKFAKVVNGQFVLKSSTSGPVRILYNPPGQTGEQECIVLFSAVADEIIAEAYALTDVCPDDASGTGTGSGSGSQAPEVQVYDFRLQPYCTLVDPPPKVTNPRNHRWPIGSLLTMTKQICDGGVEEWRVIDVELRRYCALVGIDDREACLVSAALHLGGEWCPADEPMEACVIVYYTDCGTGLPPCDTDWIYNSNTCCSGGYPGSGTGSGTS